MPTRRYQVVVRPVKREYVVEVHGDDLTHESAVGAAMDVLKGGGREKGKIVDVRVLDADGAIVYEIVSTRFVAGR